MKLNRDRIVRAQDLNLLLTQVNPALYSPRVARAYANLRRVERSTGALAWHQPRDTQHPPIITVSPYHDTISQYLEGAHRHGR